MNAGIVLLVSLVAGIVLAVVSTIYNKLKAKKQEEYVYELQDANLWVKPEEEVPVAELVDEEPVTVVVDEKAPPAYEAGRVHHLDGDPIRDYYKSVWKAAEEQDPDPNKARLSAEHLRKLRDTAKDVLPPPLEAFFRPQGEGNWRIRILPAGPDGMYKAQHWWVARRQHYLGNYGSGGRTVQCGKRMVVGEIPHSTENQAKWDQWVGECPICDHWRHLWASYDIANKKGEYKLAEQYRTEAQQIKAMERYYFNVLLIDGEGTKKGPLLWSAGKILGHQLRRMMDEKHCKVTGDEPTEIIDLVDAYDLRLIRKTLRGPQCFPQYDLIPCRGTKPVGTKHEIERCMANLWDLERVAENWAKSKDELLAHLMASGVRVEFRNCKACGKRLKSREPEHLYCSEKCLRTKLPTSVDRFGCPVCAETNTAVIAGANCYTCGFSGQEESEHTSGFVRTRCKERKDCTCRTPTQIRKHGCTCGAQHAQVDPSYYEKKKQEESAVLVDDDFLAALKAM